MAKVSIPIVVCDQMPPPALAAPGMIWVDTSDLLPVMRILQADATWRVIGLPPGTIVCSPTPPGAGFLAADGVRYAQTAYPALSVRLGTAWNVTGDPAGTFRLPHINGLATFKGTAVGGIPGPDAAYWIKT